MDDAAPNGRLCRELLGCVHACQVATDRWLFGYPRPQTYGGYDALWLPTVAVQPRVSMILGHSRLAWLGSTNAHSRNSSDKRSSWIRWFFTFPRCEISPLRFGGSRVVIVCRIILLNPLLVWPVHAGTEELGPSHPQLETMTDAQGMGVCDQQLNYGGEVGNKSANGLHIARGRGFPSP